MFQELIWTHSLIIFDIAKQIGKELNEKYNIKIDFDLLYIAALVHDIGIYNCFDQNLQPTRDYVEHGFIGYNILKKENYDDYMIYCWIYWCPNVLRSSISCTVLPDPIYLTILTLLVVLEITWTAVLPELVLVVLTFNIM